MKLANKYSNLLAMLFINSLLLIILLLKVPFLTIPVGIVFSIVLPGGMILTVLYRKLDFNWLNFTLVIGFGIAYTYIIGLFTNWFFPLFITTMPLTHLPLLTMFFIANCIITLIAYKRNTVLYKRLKIKKLDTVQIAVAVLATLAPFVSLVGANMLNNGGSANVAIFGYIYYLLLMITVYITYSRIGPGVALYTLWLLAFSILEAAWLRGSTVNGIDVNKEFQIFLLTQKYGIWNINLFRDAYNSCLSVGILPTALSSITNVSAAVVFKFIIPLLYSTIAIVIFHISNTFLGGRKAILAAFFFIAQPAFFVWWWIPIRQQVAFIFFSLIILIIVRTKKPSKIDRAAIMIFGLSMVASHYSTAYISIALFALYLFITYIIRLSNNVNKQTTALTPLMLVTMFIFVFLWYSQINIGFTGVVQFVSKSVTTLYKDSSSTTQQKDQGLFDVFNISKRPGQTYVSNEEYSSRVVSDAKEKYGRDNYLSSSGVFNNYPTSAVSLPTFPRMSGFVLSVKAILKALGAALTILGVAILVVRAFRNKSTSIDSLVVIQISAIVCMLALLAMPFFSVKYDQVRTFQQLLIPLSGATIFALFFIANKIRLLRHVVSLMLISFVGLFYIFMNQIPFGLAGTRLAPLSMSRMGDEYYTYYVSSSDYYSGIWLAGKHDMLTPIYSDFYSEYRLKTAGNDVVGTDKVNRKSVVTDAIMKGSYVYASEENSATGLAYDQLAGQRIVYYYPFKELSEQNNTVYSNGGSLIYR